MRFPMVGSPAGACRRDSLGHAQVDLMCAWAWAMLTLQAAGPALTAAAIDPPEWHIAPCAPLTAGPNCAYGETPPGPAPAFAAAPTSIATPAHCAAGRNGPGGTDAAQG